MTYKKKYTQANRIAWNMAMTYHRRAQDKEWDALMSDPEGVWQEEPELSSLLKIGIKDRRIVQLCCNNGIELLSLKRLGAGRVTGFDISDEAIKDARRRSDIYGIEAEFQACDVYRIPEKYYGEFDMVYITIGALTWLPDLHDFFKIVSLLLQPEGVLFIYEGHPFTEMLPWDVKDTVEKPVIENNYFHEGAQISQEGLDYYGGVDYEAPETFEFTHTLTDIFSAVIENGFRISSFKEYEHDISNGLKWVEKTGLRLPLCYIFCGVKI